MSKGMAALKRKIRKNFAANSYAEMTEVIEA
jgi:hypothetical protein